MIEFFRKLSHSLGAKIFFGFLALCFVFLWGGNEGLRMLNVSNEGTIAKVGSQKIKTSDFYAELQRAIVQIQVRLNKEIKPQEFQNEQFYSQLLEQMILRDLICQENNTLQVNVSDDFTARGIKTQDIFKDQSGLFSKERFMQLIQRLGFKREEDYINQYKNDVARDRLVNALSQNIELPVFYQGILYGWDEQVRSLEGLTININDMVLSVQPSEDDLRTYYGENRKQFYAPQMRAFDVLVIDHAKFIQTTTISLSEIEQFYQAEKESSYKDMTVAQAQQVIRTKLMREKVLEQVEALSKSIEQDYNDGKSLDDIAKAYQLTIEHMDAKQITDTDTALNRTGELTKAAFDQEENTLGYLLNLKSAPQSAYIVVSKITAPHPMSFKDAHPDIKQKVVLERQIKLAQGLAENLHKEMVIGQSAAALSQNKTLKMTAFKISRRGVLQPSTLTLVPQVMSALFDMQLGQIIIVPNQSPDNQMTMMILKVTDIKRPDINTADADSKAAFQQGLQNQYNNDLLMVYVNSLKEQYPITINEKLLQKMATPQNLQEN